MRTAIVLSGALAAAMMFAAAPASAQSTSASEHAFCIKKSGGSQSLNCTFDTMAACQAEAKKAGGASPNSICVANPKTAMNKDGAKTTGMGATKDSGSMSKDKMSK